MKLNVKNMLGLLEKATINGLIENISVEFTDKGRVSVHNMAADSTLVSILNIKNEVLDQDMDMELNLAKPMETLAPYLKLLTQVEQETTVFEITPRADCFTLKSENGIECNVHTCASNKIKKISEKLPPLDYLVEVKMTKEMYESYKLVKSANKTGKFYVGVMNKMLYFETGDKTNNATNSFKKNLFSLEHVDDSYMFFENQITPLMKLIESRCEDFTFAICKSKDPGMGYMFLTNGEEHYFLTSKKDL
jgi:hypothetical protein